MLIQFSSVMKKKPVPVLFIIVSIKTNPCLCVANAPTILANTNSINFIWASLNKFSPIFAQVD